MTAATAWRRTVPFDILPLVAVVAIGGITLENLPQIFEAGASGAAVISAVVSADDMASATRALKRRITECRRSTGSPRT